MARRILGLGVDLVGVERIERAVARHGVSFLQEILRPEETARCLRSPRPYPLAAACFAAKEALFKALGTGKRGSASWHDIEVVWEDPGRGPVCRPGLTLHGVVAARVAERGLEASHLSLSWTPGQAAALVVLESLSGPG